MTDRYAALVAAYAARDALAVQLAAIALGVVLARVVLTKTPLIEKWRKQILTAWDGYILLAYVGVLVYSVLG